MAVPPQSLQVFCLADFFKLDTMLQAKSLVWMRRFGVDHVGDSTTNYPGDGQINWLVLDLCDSQGHFCTAPLTVFLREPSNVNAFKNVGCHNALRTGFPDQKQWLHVAARFHTCWHTQINDATRRIAWVILGRGGIPWNSQAAQPQETLGHGKHFQPRDAPSEIAGAGLVGCRSGADRVDFVAERGLQRDRKHMFQDVVDHICGGLLYYVIL